MKDFRDLLVWKRSHELALRIYRETECMPRSELYGITSQIRRAAYSMPSNIAEGCGRGSDADFARFVQIAMGSACELEYFLLFAKDLGFLEEAKQSELNEELTQIKRMLTAFLKTLKADR